MTTFRCHRHSACWTQISQCGLNTSCMLLTAAICIACLSTVSQNWPFPQITAQRDLAHVSFTAELMDKEVTYGSSNFLPETCSAFGEPQSYMCPQ